eukprot:COSAG02_NODE_43389_length_375_cov_0.887681_1_plen_53_part_10
MLMKTEIENFQSGFPECLESVKITMGHQTSPATNSPPGRVAGVAAAPAPRVVR